MKQYWQRLDGFFFRPISTNGFGLMRIGWAVTVLCFMSIRLSDVSLLYSNEGLLPFSLGEELVFRGDYRFTILEYVTNPTAVFLVYVTLLFTTICMGLGIWTRATTIISVLLLFSFHERNLLPLGGGDTVLRAIGLLLMIAPNISAYSLDRAERQWLQWKENRTLLPVEQMAIWPWRLALWQLICIYITSGWDKMLGTMWANGTAVASAIHHEHFSRASLWLMDLLAVGSPVVAYCTLIWEFTWLLLLIPERKLTRWSRGRLSYHSLKQAILLGGILFHGSIFVLMEVGSFSIAIMTFYLGLLLQEDFDAMRAMINRKWQGHIHILYDDNCKLCRRSAFTLLLLDHLKRLDLVNYHHTAKRKAVDDTLRFEDLDKAMHIKLPDGNILKGYQAFRALCKHIPLLWPLRPLLYLPVVSHAGERLYDRIAHSRKKCTDENCEV